MMYCNLKTPLAGVSGSSPTIPSLLPSPLKSSTTSFFCDRNKLGRSPLRHSNWVRRSVPYSTWVFFNSERPPSRWALPSSVKGYLWVDKHCVVFGGRCAVKAANSSSFRFPGATMDTENTAKTTGQPTSMKVLFVEMGVGYDQHGQDITAAAMRACRDAIASNSIPAFRTGAIPGVNSDQMKLKIKLGVPRSTQGSLDVERVKSVFPYGDIIEVEVVDGGLVCSSGVFLESMGDKTDDCYIVNAAVYVGY